jgi:hypothetical protein
MRGLESRAEASAALFADHERRKTPIPEPKCVLKNRFPVRRSRKFLQAGHRVTVSGRRRARLSGRLTAIIL